MIYTSRKLAGILLIILPTVLYGGISLLGFLLDNGSDYMDNPLRRDLWRAGHAHAGVLLVLSLVILRYVDEARLTTSWKSLARSGTPISAILIPAAFFLSVAPPDATEPNALVYLAYIGFALLTVTFITLGIGLIRKQGGKDRVA